MNARALVVEDNSTIRNMVATHLRDAHINVSEASGLDEAMQLAKHEPYDVAILDITLPDGSGLDVCRRLREKKQYTPVIILTARDAESDRVLGLELGADDYVTKPFSVVELIARVRAQLRRTQAQTGPEDENHERIELDDLVVDAGSREVTVRGESVNLTALEFDLLIYLARNPGRVFTRAQLLDAVWGHSYDGFEHTVNSHINRLRAKIERDVSNPDFVNTVWGVGYSFRAS